MPLLPVQPAFSRSAIVEHRDLSAPVTQKRREPPRHPEGQRVIRHERAPDLRPAIGLTGETDQPVIFAAEHRGVRGFYAHAMPSQRTVAIRWETEITE